MKYPGFLVFEGIDGSGKSTQLALLNALLDQKGITYQHIHFPRLDASPFGDMVSAFLRGEFGEIQAVHPKLVALIYAEDRKDFAPRLEDWLHAGHLVIADRYVYSNIAFQNAKLSNEEEKQRLKDWILELEYQYFGIPQPALSLYLDLPAHAASHAIADDAGRDSRTYLAGNSDIHEADLSFQEKVSIEYQHLVASEQDFESIPCLDDHGQRLAPQVQHDLIVQRLTELQIL